MTFKFFPTLSKGPHCGRGRMCGSLLPRPPSRWSRPSEEPDFHDHDFHNNHDHYHDDNHHHHHDHQYDHQNHHHHHHLPIKMLNSKGNPVSDCLHKIIPKHVLNPVWIVGPSILKLIFVSNNNNDNDADDEVIRHLFAQSKLCPRTVFPAWVKTSPMQLPRWNNSYFFVILTFPSFIRFKKLD